MPGKRDYRRPHDERPHTYTDKDTAKILSIAGYRIYKRKKRDLCCKKIWRKNKIFQWARGYFVSTVGMNEEVIRKYIQNQENEDKKMDQDLGLFPELK